MRWLDHFVDLAPIALLGIDRARTVVFVRGRHAAALVGGEPERWIGWPIADVAKALAAPWLLEGVERAFGGAELAESRELDQRSFEVHYSAQRSADGSVAGVGVAARDVTEARKREAARTERVISLLRATLNATDDGMFTVDTSGNVGFVNQRFLRMWHVTEEVMRLPDFRQRMSFVLDQLKDPKGYLERAKQYYAHPEQETFDVLEFTDGRVYERYSHPQWVDGVCVGRVLSFRDVTKQRLAERQRDQLLAEEQAARVAAEIAERRAAFLAETGTLLASSLDCERTVAAAARRAVPDVADGCIVYTLEGAKIRCIEAVHADPSKRQEMLALSASCDKASGGVLSARALVGGAPFFASAISEEWLQAQIPDAGQRTILATLGLRSLITVPLLARGNVLGALLLFVTEPRRRYGQSDLTFACDLARSVAQAIDNARLYSDTERAVRARDEFLSIASHELRTPLTSLMLTIQSLLYLATGAPPDNLPSEIADKLRNLERKTRQLGQLVGALLDVSRSSGETLTLEPSDDVDLAKVASDVIASLSEETRRTGYQVSLIAPRPVLGRWDRLRLEQVLCNLLSNALRHGAGKPIAVRVEAGIGVGVFSVHDQGEGIAPELRAKVFEKFERGTLSRSYGGLGLGLYISRQIVSAHGGTIEVESEEGAGTTFTVTLPRGH